MGISMVCMTLLFYTWISSTDANFCVCNNGLSDSVLQKNIDYACGHGADCSAIQPNAVCYNPNTVKDHCSYAVNSYYQKKAQAPGSCDFQGTATVSPNPPSAGSGCTFQSTPSAGGTTTPPSTGGTITPPTSGGTTPMTPSTGGAVAPPTSGGTTPTTPNTGGMLAPPTSPSTGGTSTTPTTGGTTSPTTSPTFGGSSTPGVFPGTSTGIPTSSPFGGTDSSASVKLCTSSATVALAGLSIPLILYELIHPRM
ncbi:PLASMODESMATA CALLOSE-BINDING PROTEIN 3-like [Andrographis paniculata]|uniref:PLASMODESMATA CALLOSE-BINDING PROTEIN 3-like n=1 Tax=Andrographis paniculata TaxID=175694 RepID=UPI0021E783A6|nr:PLASMODESMATA CALLOSE-BINDING PROTEIN 3-like [Andrographis paniculata]